MGSIRALGALFRLRSIRALGALFRLRSIRALVALSPLAIRALVALFRPVGSIRALGQPGLRCAYPGLYSGAPSGRSVSIPRIDKLLVHRPIAYAIRAFGHPGLRCAYPGLYSGAPSGRSISIPRIDNCSFIKRFCLNTKLL